MTQDEVKELVRDCRASAAPDSFWEHRRQELLLVAADALETLSRVPDEAMLREALAEVEKHLRSEIAPADQVTPAFWRALALAAMARVARPSPSQEWQDISTAPHDEVVLLYWEDWAGRKYMEATRASHGERFPNGYSNVSRHGSATHWMPLPTPPAGGTK